MIALEVADWRRQVFALYEAVRASADPAAAHALWKAGRDELFRSHPSTPLLPEDRAGFGGLPVTDYDPAWRFELEILPGEPRRMDVETGTDGVVPFDLLGSIDVPNVGSLEVWRLASYGGGIFLPVKDGLHGRHGGTYGGGRYLLDTIKGADLGSTPSSIVVDFNFAYNPSCAYDPAWACPLAQPGNTVSTEIPVGERYFGNY
jgi:uncharacterized protein (DUF1684 family)